MATTSLVKTYTKSAYTPKWEKKPFVVDIVRLRRRVCQESYFEFVNTFWHEIVAEDPVWNWHIKVMCREAQKLSEPVFEMKPKKYDLIINVPPGSTKSTIMSILLLPWQWTRMPSLRFLGGSFDSDLSLDFGNKARRVVKSDLYKETFPNIQISDDQDTKGYFSTTLGGERRATSTGASIIGRHAHFHSVDDPINPKGVRSELDLRTAHQWMMETLPSRCVDQSVTPLALTMQRLAVDDPTGIRLERKTGVPVRHICLPAEVSDNVKPAIFKNKYKDGLLDPRRLPRQVLQNKLEELGNYGYSGQFEQTPTPLSGGMFHWDKIIVSDRPHVKSFQMVVRWWDKAATKEAGAYTAGVLMGMLKDDNAIPRFWILDVVRGQWDTWTREKIIRKTAESDEVIWGSKYYIGMEQEPGSAGVDSTKATIIRLAGFKVVGERASGDKFERADPFSVQVNAGNVGMVKATWNYAYFTEMKFFGPGCKYKDQTDASSGAFKKLSKKKLIAGAAGF